LRTGTTEERRQDGARQTSGLLIGAIVSRRAACVRANFTERKMRRKFLR
jgi:hypothetical protein